MAVRGVLSGEQRRDLILVCTGTAVTWFGNSLAIVALMLVLRADGGFALAGMFLAESVPMFLAAPLAGLLVDRLPNRKLMIAAQFGQALATLGLAIWQPSLGAVFGFVALLAVGNAIARPAAQSLTPVITGEEAATRGYAWVSAGASTGLLLGAAAGGVLVAEFGPKTALLVDAVTFAVQAATLLLVRAERRPGRHPDRPKAGQDIKAGLKFLIGDRLLTAAILGIAASNFAGAVINVAEVFFITVTLRGSAVVLGLMQAMWMIGLLIGARLAALAGTTRATALMLAGTVSAMGLAFALPSAFPMIAMLAIGYLIGGICNAAQNVCQSALIRARTPQDMRGRAFAGSGTAINALGTVGSLLGGLLVGLIGARGCFALAAGLCVLVGLVLVAATLRITVPAVAGEQRTARTV
jgi:MFS family permease